MGRRKGRWRRKIEEEGKEVEMEEEEGSRRRVRREVGRYIAPRVFQRSQPLAVAFSPSG